MYRSLSEKDLKRGHPEELRRKRRKANKEGKESTPKAKTSTAIKSTSTAVKTATPSVDADAFVLPFSLLAGVVILSGIINNYGFLNTVPIVLIGAAVFVGTDSDD